MPNIQSAKKRERQTIQRRAHNVGLRSRARTFIKKVLLQVKENNHEGAMAAFKEMQAVLDKMVKLGVYHRNNVARKKSRINAKIKALKDA